MPFIRVFLLILSLLYHQLFLSSFIFLCLIPYAYAQNIKSIELEVNSQAYGLILSIDGINYGMIPIQKKIFLVPGWHELCLKKIDLAVNQSHCESHFLVGSKIKKHFTIPIFKENPAKNAINDVYDGVHNQSSKGSNSAPLRQLSLKNIIYQQQKEYNLVTWVSFQHSYQSLKLDIGLWTNKQLDHQKQGIQWQQVEKRRQGYLLSLPQFMLNYQLNQMVLFSIGRSYESALIDIGDSISQLSFNLLGISRINFLENIRATIQGSFHLKALALQAKLGVRQLKKEQLQDQWKTLALENHLFTELLLSFYDQKLVLKSACLSDCYSQIEFKLFQNFAQKQSIILTHQSDYVNQSILKQAWHLALDMKQLFFDQVQGLNDAKLTAQYFYQSHHFPWLNPPFHYQRYQLNQSIHALQFNLKLEAQRHLRLSTQFHLQQGFLQLAGALEQTNPITDALISNKAGKMVKWIFENDLILYRTNMLALGLLYRDEFRQQRVVGLSSLLFQGLGLKLGYYIQSQLKSANQTIGQPFYVEINHQKCMNQELCLQLQLLHSQLRPFDFEVISYWQMILYFQLGFSWFERG